MTATARPRLVLDTNACLDLLLFGDPRAAPLRAALDARLVEAVCDAECRNEWLRVLDYPQLGLDDPRRAALSTAFDALVTCLPTGSGRAPDARLPRCADRDDQKFVQIAFDAQARWLVSRDREVLKLGRRTARAGWFEIVTPEDWPQSPGAQLLPGPS